MEKFKLNARYIFEGEIIVNAESEEDAIRIAKSDFGMVAGRFNETNGAILDWNFPIHPECRIEISENQTQP